MYYQSSETNYQTSVEDHEMNLYSYNYIYSLGSRILEKRNQFHTCVSFFLVTNYNITSHWKQTIKTSVDNYETDLYSYVYLYVYLYIYKVEFYKGKEANFTHVCLLSCYQLQFVLPIVGNGLPNDHQTNNNGYNCISSS